VPLVTNRSAGRRDLQPGQVSRILIVDHDGASKRVVLTSARLIEAPNWTLDGKWLIVNCEGKMFRLSVEGGDLGEIYTGSVQTCNNDHVLSPDGKSIYVSSAGHLYVFPLEGGEPRRISNDHPKTAEYSYLYYLHGVSPDGKMLAYVSVEPFNGDPRGHRKIRLIPSDGGADACLTDNDEPADGPEYSPNGEWIWFNWEMNGHRRGHAQLFRMRPDGSQKEQMTFDEEVNWFPHFSPDGKEIIFLTYPTGTISHPADVNLRIRKMPAGGGDPVELVHFFGGQGSLNVNSWSPDSSHFAYVEYPESKHP
jgi:TolB protein